MYQPLRLALLAALTLFAICSLPQQVRAEDQPVYELRVYTCEPGKLPALQSRFREHTMKLFARHDIENIAYWVPTEGPEAETTLIYLLRHQSREAAKKSWDAFRNDPEWKAVAAASQQQHGKILAKSPESTYLALTDYSPKMGPVKQDRLYELRIYTAADGKLAALHDRFRKYTDKLFTELGMPAAGYFQPLDEPKSTNTMIYVLEHKDRAGADAAWAKFMNDPRWQEAKKTTEADGRLTATRPERIYMKPTDYSPAK